MTIRVSAGSGRLIVNTSYDPVLAYRIVKDAKRGDPAMLDSLRSNYERGARPRGVEVKLALIHFGLSMYLTREMAAATAQRWPRLGNHLAEIELVPESGSCWAHTGERGHITVWGRPSQLLARVTDILPVEE